MDRPGPGVAPEPSPSPPAGVGIERNRAAFSPGGYTRSPRTGTGLHADGENTWASTMSSGADASAPGARVTVVSVPEGSACLTAAAPTRWPSAPATQETPGYPYIVHGEVPMFFSCSPVWFWDMPAPSPPPRLT